MARDNTPLLQVHNLTKVFIKRSLLGRITQRFIAVNNISFTIQQGEIVAILGANGAGKTTTIQMLLTALTPSSGIIKYFGRDLFKHRSTILQHVAFASTYIRLPGGLTVYDNLDIYARFYGLSQRERQVNIEKYLSAFGVWNIAQQPMVFLSAGEATRVMLAKAFIADPKIILLDEPTASLDLDIALEVRDFILQQRREKNISILITSHNMDEVAALCDRALVMQHGSIIADNTPNELTATITQARVELIISNYLEKAIAYATEQNIVYTIHGRVFIAYTEEQNIAKFLMEITRHGIEYTSVIIDRPSLEDYFLQMVRKPKTKN